MAGEKTPKQLEQERLINKAQQATAREEVLFDATRNQEVKDVQNWAANRQTRAFPSYQEVYPSATDTVFTGTTVVSKPKQTTEVLGTKTYKQTLLNSKWWWESSPAMRQNAINEAVKLTGGKATPWTATFAKYPEFALPAAQALNSKTLSQKDLQVVMSAIDLLDKTLSIASKYSEESRIEEFSRYTKVQQASIGALADALVAEMDANALERARIKAEEAVQFGAAQKQWLADKVGSVLDGLMTINEFAQHTYRTGATFIAGEYEGRPAEGRNLWEQIQKDWEDTSTGKMDQSYYNTLRKEYGSETVDVVRDIVQAMNNHEGDAFGSIVEKYQNNDRALKIIDEVLISSERSPLIDELLGRVDAARMDDFGNVVANALLPDDWQGTNPVWHALDKGTNFVGVFLGDPTLLAGKAIKGYKIFKYGISRNFGVGIEKALQQPSVQREFARMADSINQLNNSRTIARAAVRREVQIRHGKYLTDSAIESLREYGSFVGRDLKASDIDEWVVNMDGVEKLMMGQSAVRSPMLPHISQLRAARIDTYLSARKAVNIGKDSEKLAEALFGTALTNKEMTKLNYIFEEFGLSLEDEAAANKLVELLQNESVRVKLATEFGVDPMTIKIATTGGRAGLPSSAKYKFRGWQWTAEAARSRADRFLRNFSRMPRARRIEIATGNDAAVIREWARVGMPAYFADVVSEIWRVAPESQRRLIAAGLVDTIAKSKGIYNTTIEQRKALEQVLTTSMRSSEQYSATQALLTYAADNVDILAETSARAARMVMPSLDDLTKTKVAALNRRMAELIKQRQQMRLELKAMAYDAGVTSKRIKSEVGAAESLGRIRTDAAISRAEIEDRLVQVDDEIKSLTGQVDKVIKPAVKDIGIDVKKAQKEVSRTLSQIEKRIQATEKTLVRLSGDDLEQAQNAIARLKAQRELVKKAQTQDYFETKKILALREDVVGSTSVSLYNPSEFNGRQHALHLWQASDSITMPDFALMQDIGARVGILNRILGYSWSTNWSKATELWSVGNLWGPRYVQRAAVEDYLGYFASNGKLSDLVAGFKGSRAVREARGKKLGFFSEQAMQRFGDKHSVLGMYIGEHLNKEEILQARELMLNGDHEAFAELVSKALIRRDVVHALGVTKLDEVSEEAIMLLAKSPEGMRTIDRVAEVNSNLNAGNAWTASEEAVDNILPGALRADLRQEFSQVKLKGEYKNIPLSASSEGSFAIWWDQLHGILHRDGAIGQQVFLAMRRSDTVADARKIAVQKIVDIIQGERGAEYWRRLSILSEPGMSPRLFAEKYFDDAARMFADGSNQIPNKELLKLIERRTEDGKIYGAMYLTENGQRVDRISIERLSGFKPGQRPESVLGREQNVTYVEDANNWQNKAWTPLSESLARLSREPILKANYIQQYKELRSGLLAKYVESGIEEDAAKRIIGDMALRRAEDISISYMDNPRIRSMFAFNVRNLSRYFRATEDFYRRVLRLAKYNPEAIQKASLSYGVIDHSGFVYEDDNGQQYFIYPTTGALANAVTKAFVFLTSGFDAEKAMGTSSTFAFGGQTLMLTPSADPDSWLPTFAGPFGAIPLKVLTAFGPGQAFESALIGPKGAKPTEESSALLSEIVTSVLPGHVMRAFNAIPFNQDERNGQYASAMKSALQIMAYNGRVSPETMNSEGDLADARAEANIIATSVLALRFIFGFVSPASPQLVTNEDVSAQAREMGVKSLRSGYNQLLSKYNGDVDRATIAWFKINPRLMPFTVGSTEATRQAYPSRTAEAGSWLTKNKMFAKKYPEATVFLMPSGGDFSFDTYNLAKAAGMIQGKDIDDMLIDVITAKDYFVYQATKDDYETRLANAGNSFERDQLKSWWEGYQAEKYAKNAYLQRRVTRLSSKSSVGMKEAVLKDMRFALQNIDPKDSTLFTSSAQTIANMIATFDDGMARISKIQSSGTWSDQQKRQIRSTLRSAIEKIAGDDTNAKNFYKLILDGMIGGKN